MDITRHHKRRQSADRFLTAFSLSPPSSAVSENNNENTTNADFNEDDIFFSTETFSPQTPTSLSPTPLSLLHPNQKPFGILAATAPSPPRSVFNHTNPSRMIPVIPRPFNGDRQIRSLPVKVPVLKTMSKKFSRFGFNDDSGGDVSGGENDVEDDDGEMLPPHDMVARNLARSPVLSSSVLEGAGRTLKGRDLRQVRNAVFRQTGFID